MKRKLIRNYTWLWLIAFSIAGTFNVRAQTTFADGDIAFTRYVSDNEQFSFLFLVNVQAGTEFFITDEGWNGSGFYSNESTIKFVVNSAITAGDVIHVNATAMTYTINSGGSPITMTSVGTFNPNLGNMLGSFGDNLFVYQNSPSFNVIAGLSADNGVVGSSGNAWFASAASSTNGSVIPSGQTNGADGFIGLFPNGVNSEVDNARYKTTALYSGDKATLLASLLDYKNWDFNNSTLYAASSTSFTVPSGPAPVSASITAQTNVDCNGNSTGSLTVTASDGTPNFDYLWSNGSSTSNTSSTTNSISGLSAGTYTVTVTDDNGTTATASSTVTEPTVLSAGTGSTMNVTCNGGSDGWVGGYGSGGSLPYTYSWSNGSTNYDITGVSAGTYTLTVTDDNGCTSTASVTITEPTSLNLSTSTTASSIDLTVGGGNSPYSYLWSNGATTQDISSLSSGTYTVTVTDNNGCTASLSATAMASELVCYNGLPDTLESSAAPSGGSGNFVYQWQTSADGATAWTAAPGKNDSSIYIPSVAVTDTIYFRRQVTDTTCSATAYSNVKAIFVLDSIGISDTPVAATCGASDGSVDITVTGGQAPYTYLWSTSATTEDLSGIAAGSYMVTVTDNLGCTSSKSINIPGASSVIVSAVVDNNATCNGVNDGGATASASGGSAPYTYLWSNAATTASITSVAAGTYTVTVTDNNGCTANQNITITEPAPLAGGRK